ncbi:hypothetical protein [Methylobacterium haplocladii]|uniref:hypothetical protein n=1 Tax=Methylobacterium haplocladii TaxID=1176176 RepID=UPI001EDE0082|nr:hypothetical protein [Methylobacterium haplocladii]GJD82458.1 hypothetical protein HPGCJGGD_0314 [Methylobacterium haplocladii]GLS61247.1 hypothetical protein GCM10007887_39450 [Methylobacterium haplocladii]
MTRQVILTTARLITSAQEAIVGERLGIQRGAVEPLFVDEDGTVCAIGAALPHFGLRDILQAGHKRSNWLDLTRAGYFTYDTLDTVEAFSSLQLGYDTCFCDGSLDTQAAENFCCKLLSLDHRHPPLFQAWAELFERDQSS